MSLANLTSLHSWAEYLAGLISDTVSKQALWKRVNKNILPCLESILENALNLRIKKQYLNGAQTSSILSTFGRVFLQDSTTIKLSEILVSFYKGNISRGKQKSVLRIQAIYELLNGTFRLFKIGSFTDNDQGSARDIIKMIATNDLVIRDLGYFVIKIFKEITMSGAHFLTRFRNNCNVYCPKNNEKLKLIIILKNNVTDIDVLLGAKEKLNCRMVAIKLPNHIAAERRRKAKHNRDKRLNHSKEYMQLLDWAIFFTSVGRDVWDYKAIMKVYKIRWHIEIIFKGWKSHFNIDKLIPEKPSKETLTDADIERYKRRVDTVIYMMLIFIILFHIYFYIYFADAIYKKKKKQLSYLKVFEYIKNHKERILISTDWEQFEKELSYYASYEKRKKRDNHFELYLQLILNG